MRKNIYILSVFVNLDKTYCYELENLRVMSLEMSRHMKECVTCSSV